jgi:hypothetical protein
MLVRFVANFYSDYDNEHDGGYLNTGTLVDLLDTRGIEWKRICENFDVFFVKDLSIFFNSR